MRVDLGRKRADGRERPRRREKSERLWPRIDPIPLDQLTSLHSRWAHRCGDWRGRTRHRIDLGPPLRFLLRVSLTIRVQSPPKPLLLERFCQCSTSLCYLAFE